MAKLHVELVSPEREIWAGEADMVVAKTIEGEMGILPVTRRSRRDGGRQCRADQARRRRRDHRRDGLRRFFSVASNEVSVLAEYAELGGEVDVAAAREEYERPPCRGRGGRRGHASRAGPVAGRRQEV